MNKRQRKPERPFMPMRDGGGSFKIENPDDGTPIKEMISLEDRLLLITDKCTYEVQTADQIDPQRLNPDLPHNVQRKLFDLGVRSDALVKIFLQANILLKDKFLPLDVLAAKRLALEALAEFNAMDRTAKDFKNLEKAAIERAEKGNRQPRSVSLPSIGGVDTQCKTFAQKAHHFSRALLSIVRLFIPDATNWDKLQEIATGKFGPRDNFSKVLVEAIPTLKMVLHLRDALEHQNEGVAVRDFTMEPNGSLAPPTVELDFRKSVLPRCSVSSLMEELIAALPILFEMTIVHLSSKFALPISGFPIFVDLLPDNWQEARFVRFGFCARMGDQTVPFG